MELSYLFVFLSIFGFGADTGDSWQVTLCNIEIYDYFNILQDVLRCNEIQDTFKIKAGTNVNFEVDNATSMLTINNPSINTIEVQTNTWYSSNTNVTSSLVHFVSDGSIIFNVTNSYP